MSYTENQASVDRHKEKGKTNMAFWFMKLKYITGSKQIFVKQMIKINRLNFSFLKELKEEKDKQIIE